jgi:hypothetical protein
MLAPPSGKSPYIHRQLSYLNFLALHQIKKRWHLLSKPGTLLSSTLLLSVCYEKNPFDGLLQAFADLAQNEKHNVNYRDIDSFINFNDKNLIEFLSTTNKDTMYFHSLSNIVRTAAFSYIIIGREMTINSADQIMNPMIEEKALEIMEKYFYPLKNPNPEQVDLLKNCTCSTNDLRNITTVMRYYKTVIENNITAKNKQPMLSFLFQSNNYHDLCSTIMFAFEHSNLDKISSLRGTNSSMYHNSTSFMVNKRAERNYKESMNSTKLPSYLPEIMGRLVAFMHFGVRSLSHGILSESIFKTVPNIFILNVQGMKRNLKNNTISDIQRTSAFLDAIEPSHKKSYICFCHNHEVDPAIVNRNILFTSKKKSNIKCFLTAVRRKIFELHWKGLLTGEPIEEIICKITYATYGKYSARDIGWAVEQRFNFLSVNRDKFPFLVDSVLRWF